MIKKNVNDLSHIMAELDEHLTSCVNDKYNNTEEDDGINPGSDLLGEDSAIINCFQIKKYLKRYQTTGFKKSKLRSDLLKIIHYAMFELESTRELEPRKHINLCDGCTYTPATCKAVKIEYGNGTGNDNVIKCATYFEFEEK